MSLEPGVRLGGYEVVGLLGAGGMGEVYRARDTKLRREVAVKILPSLVAADPDRRARFTREALVLASLNHPHIASIYGIEEADGITALVLELVEGDTLADRIARGAIPIGEALAIAAQIADALDAAHEKAIVHRDLKPANIKVTDDGRVKVLDFGLAKALIDESSPDVSMSPTMSGMASRLAVIVGTAAYMSPEQAKGKPVDKRAAT
jgi:serine/threonine protein kinase